jgi:hypothetical protein
MPKLNFLRHSKTKSKLPENASTLIRTIFTLDAMRIGIFAPELRHLHNSLRETHSLSTGGVSWSALRRDINDLLSFPEKSEKITRYVRALPILNLLLLTCFAAIAGFAALDLYVLRRYPLYLVILPGLVVMCGVSTLRWYFEESIRSFFEKNRPKEDKIKRINNLLIARLIVELRNGNYPPEECTFALYHADYQNIMIKSKPKIYRGYYNVCPKASKP